VVDSVLLPNLSSIDPNDELQDLEHSIDELFQTYVTPIDALRSKAAPVLSTPSGNNNSTAESSLVSDFKNIEVTNKSMESRCHAFYRMIGLPVVGANGFYNPGFPVSNGQSRFQIANSITTSLKDLQNAMTLRERRVRETSQVFSKQDLSSSLYGLFLRNVPPFKMLTDDLAPEETDLQSFSVNDRVEQARNLSDNNPNNAADIKKAGEDFKTVQHLIKPLMVDYRLDNTVTPDSFKVCIPFLKDGKACKISNSVTLLRPGIELIIRQRLMDTTPDVNFLKSVSNTLEQSPQNLATSDGDITALVALISVNSDSQGISSSVQDMVSKITSVQVTNLSKLLRSIKICIKQLNVACSTVDYVKSQINFIPNFGPDGPITGSLGGSCRAGFKTSSSTLDTQIAELKIKKLNADRQIQDFQSLGSFASPFAQNNFSEKNTTLIEQISELTNKKNKLVNDGLNALKTIEQIKGEVSGLGLVDVLAIYSAIWGLNLDTLISFLDQESFVRMVSYNPTFKDVPEVQNRITIGEAAVPILDAISTLEKKISEIFTFADLYYRNPSIFFVNGLSIQQ